MITIYIDKRKIVTEKGMNLLQAALNNGIKIPNLCYSRKISLTGACRLCIVKIEGRKGFVASCSTLAEQGMRITAFDDELEECREREIELLCRSGKRSADAWRILNDAGFANIYNVEGGILAWADEIDTTMRKY